MILTRRAFGLALCAAPIVVACGRPKTPLAHLHGQGWVHGAYEHYGKGYRDIQAGVEQRSFESYRLLAQKGVTSLDALQSREVPFYLRVDEAQEGFRMEREVPSVLTFRADMSEADREAATAAWEKAREHIHTDYAEIRRLEWALTRLLQELQRVRSTIDETRREQFRLTRQVGEVEQGTLPFELPYQVAPKDYALVLTLLLERLEDDRARLEALEGSILAVGFAVRSTDAHSVSLAANIRKVLLAVVEDAETEPRPLAFPATEGEREALAARGKELRQAILKSPEYAAWIKEEQDRAIDQVGMIFTLFDQMTGLPTSSIYRTAVDLWRGSDDYLGYLEKLTGLVPGGRAVAKTLEQAVGLTRDVRSAIEVGKKGPEAIGQALLNTGTKYAKGQLHKQLAFFQSEVESAEVARALDETGLMKEPLPDLRRVVDDVMD